MAYGDLLKEARERAQLSKRKLGALLAERAGLDGVESGRRAIYKYEVEGGEPERERAAILAVILDEPRLALVSEPTERRQRRRGELEARVADLEDFANRSGVDLDALSARVSALETLRRPKRQRSG